MEFSLPIIYVSNYGYNAGEKNSHKNLFMSPSICKRLLWSESSHSRVSCPLRAVGVQREVLVLNLPPADAAVG